MDTSGSYIVKVTANGITTSSPLGINAIELIVPIPVISRIGNKILVSSDSTGNQWYINGNKIAAAMNQTYQPSQYGSYTVKSTLNGCLSDFSAPFNFEIPRMIDLGNGQYINLYPNPISKTLHISWNINSNPMLNIEMYGRRRVDAHPRFY